ncbi:MAG: bifunctional phosphoglucose/phosphomannose isomerase [Chloroflexi bacterium HGW-Chloroflexi-4]|jgi:glucose/mannose-6-phosphate isomerase|nr:MAG: bifunctional phosphoglucose/phosphomannose isomerase [Chloroflexi bacterium HGW-Chloroflexi-4]
MNLDSHDQFSSIDIDDMRSQIASLPDQLQKAWKLGLTLQLPGMTLVQRVVISGMGGSAIGADLLASFLMDRVTVPIIVQRNYGLPAFAFGKETLVVVSSHSGNTEEAISAFEEACRSNCQVMVITTGGKILADAQSAHVPAWVFVHEGQPRSALGYTFGLLLALFVRLGLVSDLGSEIEQTVKLMRELQTKIEIECPVKSNPAKRLAGQLVGRHITVFGSGFMAPVARRWKCQINECAKTIASFESLPEADHNTLAGICFPQEALDKEMAVFLFASTDGERNQKRVVETKQIMMLEGINTDQVDARGQNKLEQLWSTVLFGDYVAYYLAMAYEVDPTAIDPIWALKEALSK